MLLVTRKLLPDICYLLLQVTCYLIFTPAICYLIIVKPDTYYLIHASRYMSDNLYLISLTIHLLPNTYNLLLVTWYLLPSACYPNLLPTIFFWTLVTGNVTLDSFYIMLTTDYIFHALYWQIYTKFHDKNKVTWYLPQLL